MQLWSCYKTSFLMNRDMLHMELLSKGMFDLLDEQRGEKILVFPTRCDINRPVQSQKQARGLKFWL